MSAIKAEPISPEKFVVQIPSSPTMTSKTKEGMGNYSTFIQLGK